MADISKIKLGDGVYNVKDSVARENIAPVYNNLSTYVVNDLVIYQGVLYKAIQNIDIPENFNESHWNPASIATVLSMYAPINSPVFTGTPYAPTVDYNTYDESVHANRIATCGFVLAALSLVASLDIEGTSLITSDLD